MESNSDHPEQRESKVGGVIQQVRRGYDALFINVAEIINSCVSLNLSEKSVPLLPLLPLFT